MTIFKPLEAASFPTYRLLDDLADPPEHFIREALDLVYGGKKSKSLAIKTGDYANRKVIKDGWEQKPIVSKRYEVSEEFQAWIRENIAQNFLEVSMCHVEPNESGWQAAHTDWSRDYLLLYVLKNGGSDCRTCWYDVLDPEAVKKDTKWTNRRKIHTWVEDYKDLAINDSTQIPLSKWTLLNVTTMHGVENITEDRVAIHIGLDGAGLIKSLKI